MPGDISLRWDGQIARGQYSSPSRRFRLPPSHNDGSRSTEGSLHRPSLTLVDDMYCLETESDERGGSGLRSMREWVMGGLDSSLARSLARLDLLPTVSLTHGEFCRQQSALWWNLSEHGLPGVRKASTVPCQLVASLRDAHDPL